MSDQTCDCREPAAELTTERASSHDRWLVERPVTNVPLPEDVGDHMGRFLGTEPVETLAGFVAALRDTIDRGSLAVDDLCHAATETPHRATTSGETYHSRCFYDGVALAHLADEPAKIHTENPAGKPIEMQASPDGDITVTPPDAAMSFGIAGDVDSVAPDGPHPEAAYKAICPYVKAFSTRESYERWAEGVDAPTVGMPLAASVPIAAALVE